MSLLLVSDTQLHEEVAPIKVRVVHGGPSLASFFKHLEMPYEASYSLSI